jgi:hypothetical protein
VAPLSSVRPHPDNRATAARPLPLPEFPRTGGSGTGKSIKVVIGALLKERGAALRLELLERSRTAKR